MGTLRSVWTRLKPLLEAAMRSKPAAGAKADPKKTAAAISQFMAHFATVMAELEAAYKLKAQLDAKLGKAAEDGLKLLKPLLQEVDNAHKGGFNADNSLQDNMDGRITEMIDRLRELQANRSQVQWD